MQNISLQLKWNPFSLGLPRIPSDCRSFPKSIICSQSEGRDIIFHLNEKKKSAEEVTFAFRMFSSGKSFSNGTIPFVAKPIRGKTIVKGGLDFED